MLGFFVCLVLIMCGINDPDQFAAINLFVVQIHAWYLFCVLGEIAIILFCKSFVCDASYTVSRLSYIAIAFHLVGMMAYCYHVDSIYDAYGFLIVLIQTLQIWTLALYPIIRRMQAWKLA